MQSKSILIYGFAVFAMFFGSGNLVFPLKIGYISGNYWILGFLGLLITGIMLPFLGLFVIKLYQGNYDKFFEGGGKYARIFLPLFTLSLLGSFGVVPRCITVAHGGISQLFPTLSLMQFSLLFSTVNYFFCLQDEKMINILGKWLSPLLFVCLLILIIVGITKATSFTKIVDPQTAFLNGFFTGYQTMDLFAAFFFSSLIFKHLRSLLPSNATDREILKFAIQPSIIGSILLSIIYLGFVYLSSHYFDVIKNTTPELMLPTLANYLMGDFAAFFIVISLLFSCLTTAVALNNIYARYICSNCGFNSTRFPLVLLGTTFISFIISLLDLKGISAFLIPALEVSYPGLIMLTIVSIFIRENNQTKKILFWIITLVMIFTHFKIF